MVLKIYGSVLSACTQTVVTAFKEIGVSYEILPLDFASGEHKSADYLANKQPFGEVPVLVEEDGFQLYESRAIARYVIAKYAPGSELVPTGDLKKLGRFEQAASIENNNFHPYALGLAWEKVFKPRRGLKGNDERAAEYVKTLEEKLKVYEVILGKQKYLAGDEFTLADLVHLPYGELIINSAGFTGLSATTNVARWWADISSRPSWKSTMADAAAARAAIQK
ncbi:hypothetical protein M0805_007629 [Coniferiporia weirii]|nr:hypothetical protein M0805_007629 [Coniferiporia weirii]